VCSSINRARVGTRDDNGSAGHGSSGSTNLSGSRVSTRDPLTHDQVNKIRRTGCFVAVMMFDFESTSVLTGNCNSRESWLVSSRESRVTGHAGHGLIDWWVTWVTGQKVWPIVISGWCVSEYDFYQQCFQSATLSGRRHDCSQIRQRVDNIFYYDYHDHCRLVESSSRSRNAYRFSIAHGTLLQN